MKIKNNHKYQYWSLTPWEVVLYSDHTEGVIGPALGHVSHNGHCVLLRVILQYFVRNMIMIIITGYATCVNNGVCIIYHELNVDFTYDQNDSPSSLEFDNDIQGTLLVYLCSESE